MVGEVGSVRHVVEWAAVGVGDSMKRARSALGERRMEEEHIAAELRCLLEEGDSTTLRRRSSFTPSCRWRL